jgi:uncharacterized cysteine cluster protein YcgN (CxxCxxCC family)
MSYFWETKTLEQMSSEEWESLCDGCGLCCLVKLEDEESGEVHTTSASCRQLNIETCRCNDYENRLEKVSMCVQLNQTNISDMQWLPDSCAYKCLHDGKTLPEWHPLISGNKNSVHDAGVSVKFFALSEEYIHPEQLVDFVMEC